MERIIWPAGLRSSPHEHRMWAVVGVYAGEELNRLYRRAPDGLAEASAQSVSEQEVFVLDSNAIHSVENPAREWTAGLHVYGGDIVNIERSAWGPDGREVPFSKNRDAHRAMWKPMRDLAREHGLRIDGDARYLAFVALSAFCEREHRYATSAEARAVVADAWNLSSR